jgi:hypothetical protein
MAKHRTSSNHFGKPILYTVLALLGGIVLLIVSQVVKPKVEPSAERPAPTTTSAPADDSTPAFPGHPSRPRGDAAAQNLSGLLLLFGVAFFVLACICIGWLVREIQKSRPAWKRQTKYPKMRRD